MDDRVHPRDSPPVSAEAQTMPSQAAPAAATVATKPYPPSPDKPVPTPGTYVIQIPKDQIYRVPPPENARRYEQYTRRKNRRNSCCCCFFCWLIGILFILVVLLGIAAGVLYLVFRPEAPHYSIDRIAVKGMNLTTSSTAVISPEFDVTVRADNPNDKIGIRYERVSSAEIYFNGVRLCNGALPAFYQPSNNVTAFMTSLRGKGIQLDRSDKKALVKATTKRQVPLTVKLVAPVKIKVGSIHTWKITVRVNCDVTVDRLTAKAKIVSRDCNYKVKLWG